MESLFRLFSSKATLTIASILTTGSYVTYKDKNRYRQMEEAFSGGKILPPFGDSGTKEKYFGRPDLEEELASVLSPEVSGQYYLINGAVGSGKTRTIVEMVGRLMEDSGRRRAGAPIFVHVSQGKSFPDALASSVNFFFDEHVSLRFFADFMMRIDSFPKRDEHQKLNRLLEALEASACRYLRKTGRSVVLVVDGVNNLTEHMAGALDKLQRKAKIWADTNIIKVIFICNDEHTSETMQGRSSTWSRAALPIYFSDMSKERAIAFLMEPAAPSVDGGSRGKPAFSAAEAETVYEAVGGRVYHLTAFRRNRSKDVGFEKTANELMNKEREKFLNVSTSGLVRKAIDLLIQSGGKGVALAELTSSCSESDVAALLQYDIIRIERRTAGLTAVFESKLTENVINHMT